MNLSLRVAATLSRFSNVRRALGLVWKAAGGWTLAWSVMLVVQGVLPAAMVYLLGWLVDSLASAAATGLTPETLRVVLVPAGIYAGLILLQQILGSLGEWISTAQSELVRDYIKALLHAKSTTVDYSLFESAEYYNQLEQANTQSSTQALSLLQNIGGVLQSLITFVAIGVLLLTYSGWLPLILLVSTLPALYVVVRYNGVQHDWWQKTTPDRRWAEYFDMLVTTRMSAAEMRALGTGDFFQSQYQRVRKRLREERLKLFQKQIGARLAVGALGLGVTGGAMLWMLRRVIEGSASLGDIAAFYSAFNQGQGLMRTLLSGAGQIYTNALFLDHLFSFLDQKVAVHEPVAPQPMPAALEHGIDFEGVTFRYPGAERAAIEGFSLHLPAGRTTAIVGANGAGKSTLTKLLLRLYDPEAGRVLADGVDLKTVKLDDLRSRISIMFQFPINYQATAANNIAVGDEIDRTTPGAIERAARGAGAHEVIERLPQGYGTMLGRLFQNSHDLSGGEWQRVALARAFLREAPIVVLDEPTSFMDSWAENEWLQRFRTLVKGHTALIITHRFTTAMQADIIHVMERGRIVESGNHASLLRSGGRYAESWRAQTEAAHLIEQPDVMGEPAPGFSAAPPVDSTL